MAYAYPYPGPSWRKSSASAGEGECVEIAKSGSFLLARDSRDRSGPVLRFTVSEWRAFLQGVRNGKDRALSNLFPRHVGRSRTPHGVTLHSVR
jgi:hypothetical protein